MLFFVLEKFKIKNSTFFVGILRGTMFKLLKNLGAKEWGMVLASVAFIVLHVWLDLRLPDYMSTITLLVQTPGSSTAKIWENGGYMLACALGRALCSVVVGYFCAKIAAIFSLRVREKLFLKVQSFSLAEIKKFSTASLITRSTNDVTQVQMVIAMGLQVIIKSPILATWAIIKILGKSWQWSIATAVAVVFMLVVIAVLMAIVVPKFKKMQTLTDNLNRVTRENLMGIRVVRAYNAEEFSENKFEEANSAITKNSLFVQRTMSFMGPMMSIVMSGLSLAIYWIGAAVINQAQIADKMTIFSDMVVFSSYAVQVVMAFMMLTMIFAILPRALVSARRINEVLETNPSIEGGDFDGNTAMRGQVEFKNVSFRYPDAEEYVLHNVSFVANQGETVAFIGSTGSGKSTLINLVPRFYDATEGEILVDGVNVKEYDIAALNDKLGYVSQKAVLFSGTIESNINFGDKEVEIEQIDKAIKISQAAEFVKKLEKGTSHQIVQGGKNISGGQKQRLSIARALAKEPEIMIFDDSFSALDYKTDRKLRTALDKMENKPTSLIVAQRIGTIKDADKIVVLDSGEMVGIGTHEELMKNCKVYQEIALSQLSKEELA